MMMTKLTTRTALVLIAFLTTGAGVSGTTAHAADGVHLFVLSGQSNMNGHRPDEAFTPAVTKKFGVKNVVVVQDAQGGQPILRWHKDWHAPDGSTPDKTGDLYDRLISKVKPAIKGKKIATVTFFWMQGERDARSKWGDVYERSLRGIHKQLSDDLGRDDVNFVIGRLSDHDMENRRYPHWTKLRQVQQKVADSNPRFAWIDTDDLNDGKNRRGNPIKNDLHMSGEGYKTMGERFAEKAIALIDAYEEQ